MFVVVSRWPVFYGKKSVRVAFRQLHEPDSFRLDSLAPQVQLSVHHAVYVSFPKQFPRVASNVISHSSGGGLGLCRVRISP